MFITVFLFGITFVSDYIVKEQSNNKSKQHAFAIVNELWDLMFLG